MNLLILGPQGSGKGTQAELLVKKFGLLYVEMGSILRELSQKDAELDRLINKEGSLVPDETTAEIFRDFLKKNSWEPKLGLMLDGFPRTPGQYEFVKRYLAEFGEKLDHAIFLEISELTSIQRLSARRVCSGCGKIYSSILGNSRLKPREKSNAGGRHNLLTNPPKGQSCDECGGDLIQREDDKEEAIKRRLAIYRERTEPLVKILEQEGILIKVDGERRIEIIFKDILVKLAK